MYGQALLDIPCYKILMGCDGKNLQETTDLYNLTDAEQELLESKRRGHALFLVGSKRLHVNFEIPAYKFAYMGKAGRPVIYHGGRDTPRPPYLFTNRRRF